MIIKIERKVNIVLSEEDILLMAGMLQYAASHIAQGDDVELEEQIRADITDVKRFISTLSEKLNLPYKACVRDKVK